MKASKTSARSKRLRRLLKEQVLDHVRRYHPEMGDVVVEISPRGTVARVLDKSAPNGSGTS